MGMEAVPTFANDVIYVWPFQVQGLGAAKQLTPNILYKVIDVAIREQILQWLDRMGFDHHWCLGLQLDTKRWEVRLGMGEHMGEVEWVTAPLEHMPASLQLAIHEALGADDPSSLVKPQLLRQRIPRPGRAWP
jgi:hypothetical protein